MKASERHSGILVSHGQPSEPGTAERELAALRDRVAPCLPNWSVASATLANPGAVEAALRATGPVPLVYPVFMTDGWFTRTALPKRFEGTPVRFLKPLGTDPALPGVAANWLADALEGKGWTAASTCLVVAAHGSGRSRNPSRDTRAFADALQKIMGFADVRVGFIEEPPVLVDVLAGAGPHAICLPFFAARRGHVLEDLPEALAATGFSGLVLEPIGLHATVPEMIAEALRAAARTGVPA